VHWHWLYVGGVFFNALPCADDMVTLARRWGGLQRLIVVIDIFSSHTHEIYMTFNNEKTMYVQARREGGKGGKFSRASRRLGGPAVVQKF